MRVTRLVFVLGLMAANSAMAADGSLDVTITVVDSPGQLPSAVTKTIELPPAASDIARERSAKGMNTANEARERGREFGRDVAEGAKARGKGNGRP